VVGIGVTGIGVIVIVISEAVEQAAWIVAVEEVTMIVGTEVRD
jgi:hypothetical protein